MKYFELVLQLDRGVGDVLHQRRGDQLADRGFRARRLAARQGGLGAQPRQPQALGAHIPVGDLFAQRRVLDPRARQRGDAGGQIHDLPVVAGAAADGVALVHQRDDRDPPALAHRADALAVLHPQVGEVDLVEARGARHLVDRAHVDGRIVHVDPEHREAPVLRHVGIGAGDHDAEVRIVRAGGPDLLAVDDPVTGAVVRLHGAGARRGDVRSA